MNILVTGSTGFLGRVVVEVLSDHNVYTLNRLEGDFPYDLQHSVPKFGKDFELVIHSAAKAHSVPKSVSDCNSFIQTNILGVQNLLKGLELSIPKKFVFISSVAVYGLDSGMGITEDTNLGSNSIYGLTKLIGEKLVTDWCENNGVICTIFRLPLLVGDRAPGNLGNMMRALKSGYYFNVNDGRARKSMVLAEDVAEFIPTVSQFGGIYNLTDGFHPSLKELSEVIGGKRVFNLPFNLARYVGIIGDRLGDDFPLKSIHVSKMSTDLTFDDSKARKVGWRPKEVLGYIHKNGLLS